MITQGEDVEIHALSRQRKLSGVIVSCTGCGLSLTVPCHSFLHRLRFEPFVRR